MIKTILTISNAPEGKILHMGEHLPTAEQNGFAPEETAQILGQLALEEEVQLSLPIQTVE